MTSGTYERLPPEVVTVLEECDENFSKFSVDAIKTRTRAIDTEIGVLKNEVSRLTNQLNSMKRFITGNTKLLSDRNNLPYLVGTVVELYENELDPSESTPMSIAGVDFDFASLNLDKIKIKNFSVVVKTSARNVVSLPRPGLVDGKDLKVGDMVGLNKDTFLILERLPRGYDTRVQAMEVIDPPSDTYAEIGGLDKQIEEIIEAIVLPLQKKELFDSLGISSSKGVLLYGPPGTGKTLLVRAVAAEANATVIKLAASQLVQMFIGDGAKLVKDVFELAREKQPAIVFIDEIDAIGTKRSDSSKNGDREVQRTMLALLTELDGFGTTDMVKVICATNRAEQLDPALLRSGRLDRKIEFPHPDEAARERILRIHSGKMKVDNSLVNFRELARSTQEMNGAQLKAVCIEAGMSAIRRDVDAITHADFTEGLNSVLARKQSKHNYYA